MRAIFLGAALAVLGGSAVLAQPNSTSAKPEAPVNATAKAHTMRERETVQNEDRLAAHDAARGDTSGAKAERRTASDTKRELEKTDQMRYREKYQNDDRMAKKAAARGDKKGGASWAAKAKQDRADRPEPLTTH